MAGAQRRQIALDSLVVRPSLQIVLSSFSGAHTLLLVRKKEGREGESILDDGKRVGGGGGEEGYLTSLSGGISSWLGGAKGNEDDTVSRPIATGSQDVITKLHPIDEIITSSESSRS